MKFLDFQRYYNGHRTQAMLDGCTPDLSVIVAVPRDYQFVSMATALSRDVPNANGGDARSTDVPGRPANLVPCLPLERRHVLHVLSGGCG
jgi:hypothetical protein